MPLPNNFIAKLKRQPRGRLVALALAALAGGYFLFRGGGPADGPAATFTARQGPLDITVLEGGGIQALESQEIKCEARVGYQGIKILKIVEEGYQVTDEDIRTNKVLVELDSSELEKLRVQQEIQFQSASASLTDAQQGYEIQLNQNLSDIKAAEQKARFALMDFDKFLGASAARDLIEQLGIERELRAEQTNATAQTLGTNGTARASEAAEPLDSGAGAPPAAVVPAAPAGAPAPANGETAGEAPAIPTAAGAAAPLPPLDSGAGAPPAKVLPAAPAGAPAPANGETAGEAPAKTAAAGAAAPLPALPAIDFSRYADLNLLGDGEAKQKLRDLLDSLQVSQKEAGQAKSTLAGTQRLFDKGFATKVDLERDEIAAENARLKVQKAETARGLFLQYEFKKSAEEWLSKYVEAARELNRARKAAVSKLAQAESRFRSAQVQFNVQQRQLKEMTEQVGKCIIHAKKPGLVVFGGGGDDMYYGGGQERIREGSTVRERQSLITIPNMTNMGVRVRIHESYIKKVKKGQKVRITADAFPDQALQGEVTKVGVLPDSAGNWMNPDLKVYLTTITISDTVDWLKPGMTAKVEVLVDRLPDVVYVPVQAVTPQDGHQVCHVIRGGSSEPRTVEIGQFNDEFVEIKQGLKAGEKVLLRPPDASARGGDEKPKPTAPAAKAAAPMAKPQ